MKFRGIIAELCTLKFKEFLVEMETTPQEKEQIRTLIRQLIGGNSEWFKQYSILVGDKGPYWILNYSPGPRNEFNRLVRGMVVAKPQPGFTGDPLVLIKSFPFIRFYNQHEKEAAPVDLANAEMMEKMDGTMVGVFFPDSDPSKPQYHTRKMLSTHDDDVSRKLVTFHGQEFKFMPLIGQFVNKLNYQEKDVYFTYVFEFLHEASYVLTKYKPEKYGLYLLGARNLITHRELSERELDKKAAELGAFRPRRFDTVADNDEISKMFDIAGADAPDFEGFIFRDKESGNRIKVKDPRYVQKHHLLDNSKYKNLIPLILQGEEEEIAAYFPHVVPRIKLFKEAYANYLNKVIERVKHWRSTGLKGRDLSLALFGENPLSKWELRLAKLRGEVTPSKERAEKDKFICNMVLKYSDIDDDEEIKAKIDKELKEVGLGQGTNLGNPKGLIELIGLNDDEDEQQPDVGEM